MINILLTNVFLFYFPGIAQCAIFTMREPPLHISLQQHFIKSMYAKHERHCALHCETTQNCQSFLFQEKDCYRNSSKTYIGTVSTTLSASTCEDWTLHLNEPYVVNEAFPDHSVKKAKNYCRDPNNAGYPWCFTSTGEEPCDIPDCKKDYTDNVCLQTPTNAYVGEGNHTNDGTLCQRWDSDIPHTLLTYKDNNMFPDGSVSAAGNNCRDPGNDGYLWCYTTDENYRWKSCDVRSCRDMLPLDLGRWSTTITGIPCQRWDSHTPHTHKFTDAGQFPDATHSDAANTCRDPGGSKGYLWCYTTNSTVPWQPCGIPKCMYHIPCRSHPSAQKYTGSWAKSYTGKTCQRWDGSIHADDAYFPSDFNVGTAHNFCRDPNKSGHLWCYITDPSVAYDVPFFCDVALCQLGHDTDNCQLFSASPGAQTSPSARVGYKYYSIS